jgi:hypothetical protein
LHPAIDFFAVETPITAHFEGRNFARFEQSIDGGFVNAQELCDFIYCHYTAANAWHLTTFQLAHYGTQQTPSIPPLMTAYALILFERKRLKLFIRFAGRRGKPLVNRTLTKAPVTTDPEAWDPVLSQ